MGLWNFPVDEDQGEDEEEETVPDDPEIPITPEQVRVIEKYHRNLGHASKEVMLRTLKAARSKPQLLQYVRHQFSCPDCDANSKARTARPASIPRTFEFNRIVAVDVFYVKLKGESIAVLNVVDHGSSFQLAGIIGSGGPPIAMETWRTFVKLWRRFFGLPEILMSDGGS